jgi:hypothetical protein
LATGLLQDEPAQGTPTSDTKLFRGRQQMIGTEILDLAVSGAIATAARKGRNRK